MKKTTRNIVWIGIVAVVIAGGALLSGKAGALFSRSGTQKAGAPSLEAVSPSPKALSVPTLSFENGPIISILVADTDQQREQGLSGHAPLSDREGMLFFFDTPGRPAFWMKDMLFSLDIIWISSDWRVVDISPNLSPDTYPASFAPKADIKYVLEVPAGFAQRHGIAIGQRVTLSGWHEK